MRLIIIHSPLYYIYVFLTFTSLVSSIDIDVTSTSSIKNALYLIQDGVLDYYQGTTYGGTVGMFVDPYYWWEAGAALGSLLDTWYFTKNTTYEDLIMAAMLHQTGDDNNYIPENQTYTEGNDDQGFWGILAIGAVERNFTNPASDEPQWLYIAQAVYNTMAARWDSDNCGGGLRWQIFTWNSGYDYKNTVANGCLMHIASRLARYTSNDSYAETAEKVWDWVTDIGYITSDYIVYDGGDISENCTDYVKYRWSYNYGLYLSACAYMYNYTEDSKWLTRVEGLLNASSIFFKDNIMYEVTCQNAKTCNNDERCFKAIFSRFLGLTSTMAPTTNSTIYEYLSTSAAAAAKTCNGGSDGHTCGMNWQNTTWDGYYGLGEEMSALEVIQNVLSGMYHAPYSASTGGSSNGSSDAGVESSSSSSQLTTYDVTIESKDKAGAGVLTAVGLIIWLAIIGWMVLP